MPVAWRIVKVKHAGAAFTGEGAAKVGGRWNSRGTAVVYASSTKSLAALEILVHLVPPVTFALVAFRIEFDEGLIERIPAGKLPRDWKTKPTARSSRAVGDSWVGQARTAVLEVPSALISDEPNYLLNPAHPDFLSLIIRKPEPFSLDPRLVS